MGWAVLDTVVITLIGAADPNLPLAASVALPAGRTLEHRLLGVRDVQRIRARRTPESAKRSR